jgi:hypothetical protein
MVIGLMFIRQNKNKENMALCLLNCKLRQRLTPIDFRALFDMKQKSIEKGWF